MKRILFYILILTLLVPVFSKAQEYTLLEPLPCVAGTGNNCTVGETIPSISLETYVGYVFKFSIALAAALAVIMIIWGGFEYMLSESLTNKSTARARIQNAITGLIMVLASYLILRTIDPRLVQVYTKIPPLNIELTEEELNFENKLTRNLEGLSEDAKQKAENLAKENQIKQSEIDILKTKATISEGLTEAEKVRLATLQQEVKKNDSEIIIASTEGSTSKLLLEALYTKDAIHKTFSDAQDKIDALTKTSIEELKKVGDFEGVQRLEKQQKFYSTQTKEQGEVIGNILSVERGAGDKYAKADLTKYKREYEELTSTLPPRNVKIAEIKSDPYLAPLYTTMLEARIDALEVALKIEE
jgi:hypothetical protein